MRVVADGSPLRDGRRHAGIGRYVDQLSRELRRIPDVDFSLALSPPPPSERTVPRWLTAQPWVVTQALASRADILHGMASEPIVGWPLQRQIVTVHDVAFWTTHLPPPGSPTGRYLMFQRRRFPRCAAVVVDSDAVAVDAARILAVPTSRIHVVPLGVGSIFTHLSAPTDAQARRRVGIPEGDYVLWVGMLRHRDPRKSIDDLLDAMTALSTDRPTLVLAGRAGDEAARLARVAADRKVRAVVTGYVDDAALAALYRGAAAVAVPSQHEGFGLTVLEALACGAPVVATSGGNLAALAGDAAVVVPPGDVGELSRALGAVHSDPDLRNRLRAAGPKRAAPFTWKRAADLTAEVYRQALREIRRRPASS